MQVPSQLAGSSQNEGSPPHMTLKKKLYSLRKVLHVCSLQNGNIQLFFLKYKSFNRVEKVYFLIIYYYTIFTTLSLIKGGLKLWYFSDIISFQYAVLRLKEVLWKVK